MGAPNVVVVGYVCKGAIGGDKRASATRDYLIQLGVPADKLKSVSYGKERPVCNEADEACYQKNRRAHFAAAQ